MRVEITDAVIPAAEIVAGIKAGSDGAVCVFDGIVRDNSRGRKTLYLDYEAYREMALEQMRGLAGEAVTKFGVRDVTLGDRLGRVGGGGGGGVGGGGSGEWGGGVGGGRVVVG